MTNFIQYAALLCLVMDNTLASGALSPKDVFRDDLRMPEQQQTQPTWNNPQPQMSQIIANGANVFAPSQQRLETVQIRNQAAAAPQPITASASSLNPIDSGVSEFIATSVLDFAHNIGIRLGESAAAATSKCEVFSPLSVMSALSLLMLGAKGKSYLELKRLFGIDYHPELRADPSKFHEEFGYMLQDLREDDIRNISPRRQLPYWRSTQVKYDLTSGKRKTGPNGHAINLANGLFAQTGYNLNPDYKNVIKSIYRSELTQLDFQQNAEHARNYINEWVKQNTYGKISNIIDGDVDQQTNVIIASALYFKGFWETDFFESVTKWENFFADGETALPVKALMMATGGNLPFYDAPDYGCRIIGMPYRGNLTTMYVIQPYQSSRVRLREMQRFLDAQKIDDMISRMVMRSAILAFPKMHLQRKISMKNLLRQLNINDIFANGVSDLSLIAKGEQYPQTTSPARTVGKRPGALVDRYDEQPLLFSRSSFDNGLNALESQRYSTSDYSRSDLFVDDIVHKVDFEVNEHGTEAAAATATYLKKSGPEVLFRADSPFLFLVRHDPTKLVLFYGFVNEPVL